MKFDMFKNLLHQISQPILLWYDQNWIDQRVQQLDLDLSL